MDHFGYDVGGGSSTVPLAIPDTSLGAIGACASASTTRLDGEELVDEVTLERGVWERIQDDGVVDGIESEGGAIEPDGSWNLVGGTFFDEGVDREGSGPVPFSRNEGVCGAEPEDELGDGANSREGAPHHDANALVSQGAAQSDTEVRSEGVEGDANHLCARELFFRFSNLAPDGGRQGTVAVVRKENLCDEVEQGQVAHDACPFGQPQNQFIVEVPACPVVAFRKIVVFGVESGFLQARRHVAQPKVLERNLSVGWRVYQMNDEGAGHDQSKT
jgi:hypothetical protein